MFSAAIPPIESSAAAMARARERVAQLIAACDALPPRFSADVRAEALTNDTFALCREMAGNASLARELSDLAFMAAADLRSTLARVSTSPAVEQIDEYTRALRHVMRTLSALEQALGMERARGGARERVLRASIATRRRYASVRRAVLAPSAPTDAESLARSLTRVRLQVTLLVKSEVHAMLRRTDRAQVDDLATRLDRVLADGALDVREAERLWQDLIGFARLTLAINRRHELVESDTEIVAEASEAIASEQELPPRLRARLEMLAGLDDEIDALLETYDWSIEPWRAALAIFHERLVRPATGRFARTRR